MDTYTKMVDCPEIQGHKWTFGDKIVFKSEVDIREDDWSKVVLSHENFFEWEYYQKYHGLFIPRQEDIQEMLEKAGYRKSSHGKTANQLWDFDDRYGPFKDWTHLWLAFYMHEVYGKIWSDEKKSWAEHD